MSLTHRQLLEIIDYEPSSGVFRWNISRRRVHAGDRAGSINGHGYRQICIDKKMYRCGRLAWFYMRGRWPRRQIDHRNRNRSDDRACNLRRATQQQNNKNRGTDQTYSRRARRTRKIENLYLKGWREGWAI